MKTMIANLRLAPSIWCPMPHQVLDFPNPSRLQSLWIGTVAQLYMLPVRLWREFLAILLKGRPLVAALSLLYVMWSTLLWVWWGVRGTAFGVDMPARLVSATKFLPPDACDAAIRYGSRARLWHVPGGAE